MSRAARLGFVALLLIGSPSFASDRPNAPGAEGQPSAEANLPQVTFYNGSDWALLPQHAISLEGPGSMVEGTATARLKSNLGGPKTYAVLAEKTSEISLSVPRPRFRISGNRAEALRVQLAQFEVKDEARKTVVEKGKVTVFTKGIDLEVTRVADGLWELKPTKSLQPGEYALAVSDVAPVADFTIVERGY